MPRGDRKGPFGAGPMTGRAAGFCAGFGIPGFMNRVPGRGVRSGFGSGRWYNGGRGWRNRFFATGMPGWMDMFGFGSRVPAQDPEQEQQALRAQADALQNELNTILKRLDEISK